MGSKSPERSRGFTLLELIVSMVLITLAMGLTSFFVLKGITGRDARRFPGEFRRLLALARMEAVVKGEEVFLCIDQDDRKVWLEGTDKVLDVPQEVALQSEGIKWSGAELYKFPFFPDGSCAGGKFVVKTGDREWVFHLNPASGLVE